MLFEEKKIKAMKQVKEETNLKPLSLYIEDGNNPKVKLRQCNDGRGPLSLCTLKSF